jgi:hypothetical protein
VWSEVLSKILTIDNLQKLHVIVVDWCVICKKNGEFVDDLLLRCEVACAIWNAFFKRFELYWVMLRQVVDMFACWWISSSTRSVVVWKRVHLCLL